jgi:hypothetical protein
MVKTLVAGTSWSTKPARKRSGPEAAVDAVGMAVVAGAAAIVVNAVVVVVDAAVTAAIAEIAGNPSPAVLSSLVFRANRPFARSAQSCREFRACLTCVIQPFTQVLAGTPAKIHSPSQISLSQNRHDV